MIAELTPEQMCSVLLAHVRDLVWYWGRVDDVTTTDRLIGLVHSILVALDGMSPALPPMALVPDLTPHEALDRADLGGGLWPRKQINEGVMLHHMSCKEIKRCASR